MVAPQHGFEPQAGPGQSPSLASPWLQGPRVFYPTSPREPRSPKGKSKDLEGVWPALASSRASPTTLAEAQAAPSLLPASPPAFPFPPSLDRSPLHLVPCLALFQAGGPGPFLEAHLRPACWEGALGSPFPGSGPCGYSVPCQHRAACTHTEPLSSGAQAPSPNTWPDTGKEPGLQGAARAWGRTSKQMWAPGAGALAPASAQRLRLLPMPAPHAFLPQGRGHRADRRVLGVQAAGSHALQEHVPGGWARWELGLEPDGAGGG